MAYNLSAFAGAGAQFFDSNGTPLAGGLLYVYTAGTTTPATSWTTSSGTSANTNPIVMNAAGRTPFEIWLNSGVTYKFALYTSTNVLIGTYDNIPAIDDPTVFNNLITVTGTDTLIGVSVPPYTSYVAGMTLSFIPVTTNTGAVTLDLDGLGAKNLFVGSSTALVGGELVAGRIAQIEYDGTRFQLYQSTITNVVNLTGNQTIAGTKTFSSPIAGSVTGSAATATALSSASGSAPSYAARAWVNFDGTGTPAIRASGNVSSITDFGVGIYGVNFTTAMQDANYAISGMVNVLPSAYTCFTGAVTDGAVTIYVSNSGLTAASDPTYVSVAIHR